MIIIAVNMRRVCHRFDSNNVSLDKSFGYKMVGNQYHMSRYNVISLLKYS